MTCRQGSVLQAWRVRPKWQSREPESRVAGLQVLVWRRGSNRPQTVGERVGEPVPSDTSDELDEATSGQGACPGINLVTTRIRELERWLCGTQGKI